MSPDALLNAATEWAASCPRRLAFIIAALIAAPHFVEGVLL